MSRPPAKDHRPGQLYLPEKMRDALRIRLLSIQKNRCAICGKDFTGETGKLHIDHDHTTRQIRGLLCRFCNHAVGCLRDSVASAQALIAYLRCPPLDPPVCHPVPPWEKSK